MAQERFFDHWSGVLPMIWLMVVFSYAYGHAFSVQANFEQIRISRIVAAASSL